TRALSNRQPRKHIGVAHPAPGVSRGSPLLDVLTHDESVHQMMDSRGDYAIFMLDATGCVASWNKGAHHIKGFSRSEILGEDFSVFYTAEDRAAGKPKRDLGIAARDGRFEQEALRVRKDGSTFWGNIVLSAVRDRSNALAGFVKVTRDLTESRGAQERAVADGRALKAANAELEAFTYSVSHDLRAPIRQIEGFSKILAEYLGDHIDPQVAYYLKRIGDGSQHMTRLVNDLLDLSHVGQKQPSPRLTSLDPLIARVLRNVQAEIRDRDIEWRIGSFPAVMCDPGLMDIVFTNLLSNAVKYTRPRDKAVIEVGHMIADRQLVIYVRDNGVGFNMKYADKLFGVFQRLHRAEEFEGAGVGLATVQRIIRKHNGRVWAESSDNGGATFFFTLGGNFSARTTAAPG
ncbi:MAG TPA: ATP-binding protein, partial [Gemmatimonadaceae bacterium]